MAAKGGKDLLLKVNTTGSTYVTIAGLRSKSFSISADGIDVTNHGSNQNRTFLDGAGILSMSVSGSGVFDDSDATISTIQTAVLAQTLTRFQIVDNNSGDTYTAYYKIVSFERTGEYNGEMIWTISLESSGAITIS